MNSSYTIGVFTSNQLREIKKTTLAKVMCNNLKGMVSVQEDVFRAFKVRDFRKSCDQIRDANIAVWRENSFVSDRTGKEKALFFYIFQSS